MRSHAEFEWFREIISQHVSILFKQYDVYNLNNIHYDKHEKISQIWLARAVKFQDNIVPKKGNTVICLELPFSALYDFFPCILLFGNSMISRATWKNTHSWIFQRPQVTLIIRTRTILIVWKTHSRVFFPNCTQNHAITYTNKFKYFNLYKNSTWFHSCDFMWSHVITRDKHKYILISDVENLHVWFFTFLCFSHVHISQRIWFYMCYACDLHAIHMWNFCKVRTKWDMTEF